MWKDILKKNAVSIACGVIALVAVIASFWPADTWIEELKTALGKREAVNRSLETLNTKVRNLPNLDPNSTTPVVMKDFPNDSIIAAGKAATAEMKQVSAKLFDTAVQINFHQLLVPNSLPKSRDVQKLEFRQAYQQAFRFTFEGQVAPDFNIPIGILKAAQPPTPEEIAYDQTQLWDDKYASKIVTINGVAANFDQQANDYTTEATKLPDVMKQQRAEKFKIYVMPDALTINTAVGGSGVPKEEDIWYAQLGLWIQQDVAGAIAAANAPSTRGVIDGVVKQLIQLNVPLGGATPGSPLIGDFGGPPRGMPPGMFGGGMPGGMPGAENGAAGAGGVISDPAAVLKTDFTTTPTGRVATGLYDVYDFVLTVDVEAARLPVLLNELTRGRYISVHTVDLTPVDLTLMQSAGFIYGDKPVVRAVLTCEILYMRNWTEKFMPVNVKRSLGIADPVPVAAQ